MIDLSPSARADRIDAYHRMILSDIAKPAASLVPHPGVSAAGFGVPESEARETSRDEERTTVASGTLPSPTTTSARGWSGAAADRRAEVLRQSAAAGDDQ